MNYWQRQYAAQLQYAAQRSGLIGGDPFAPAGQVGTLAEQLAAVEVYTATNGPLRRAVGQRRAWSMCRSFVATSVTAPTRRPTR